MPTVVARSEGVLGAGFEQCYPEYIIHYKRVPGTPLSASMGAHRARRGAQCHYPL